MSKVAIITDTHYGARKGSKLFHDYFEKFYNDIFFPNLDEHGIDTVIHMGDAFDSRKGIDFKGTRLGKTSSIRTSQTEVLLCTLWLVTMMHTIRILIVLMLLNSYYRV